LKVRVASSALIRVARLLRVRVAAGALISVALLVYLLSSVQLGDLAQSMTHVNLWLVGAAICLYFVGVLVRAFRWRLILAPIADVPLGRLFNVMVIGFTVNNLLPARVGEIARAYLLSRSHRVPKWATLGSIVVERLLDGLTLCAFVLLGWLNLPLDGWIWRLGLLGSLAFAAAFIGLWIAANPPRAVAAATGLVIGRLPGGVSSRIGGALSSFSSGLAILRRGPMVGVALAVSVIAWTIEAAMFYVIALAFPLDVGPLAALFGMGVANLGTMIPAAPGYVGTFDVPLAAVLELAFSVPRPSAIGYTLVVHAALVVPVVLLGLLLMWREGLSLRSVAPPKAERDPLAPPRGALAPQHASEGPLWRTGETGGIVGQD
jgi:uncharacterized protein (TIRG00374 family)